MEKIYKFEIDKLYNRFDYTINLSSDDAGLAILAAPNGYGKTTILKMIESFSKGDFIIFFKEQYSSVRFFITNHKSVEIVRVKKSEGDYGIIISDGVNRSELDDPLGDSGFVHTVNLFEKYIPYLRRIGARRWRDDRVGDIISFHEAISRYKSHPALRRIWRKKEAWIEKITSSISVFSISTNRLNKSNEISASEDSDGKLMVKSIADNIKDEIRDAIRNQFEEGRKKETSFPTRIINALATKRYPDKDSVLESINELQKLEEDYSRLGLIPNTETTNQFNTHIQGQLANGAGLLVLKTYLDDVLEKFSQLDGLAKKLDVFSSSINSLLSFKEVTTTIDEGFVVRLTDGDGEPVHLESLSSGEQHLLVLIGKLVFETTAECMVLIDEPEISFHPEWQEAFISILTKIREINGFDVVMATHSPILIGNEYWDYVVELAEQYVKPDSITFSSDIDL
ncbi:AAA family ATPase [Klebsiella variicola]|uniref:AAA family ATPase n=1 Tax=Klebsiella variicola TaxID=244366 RepID=UPI002B05E143|nr:AAA family ATPase [Klebsiella variicola]